MPILAAPAEVRGLLDRVRTIAVVGLSADPSRDSHRVAAYLAGAGYRVIGVNPKYEAPPGPSGAPEFLGEPVRPSLKDIPEEDRRWIDLVNVFRRPEFSPAIARETAALGIPAIWFQLGCSTPEGVAETDRAGLTVVDEKCIMVAHRMLLRSGEEA